MNLSRYAPPMPTPVKKKHDSKTIRYLLVFAVVFLVMELLLLIPGMWLSVMMVKTWLYILTGGISIVLFLIALTIYCFRRTEHRFMLPVAVTVACVLITVGFAVGYMCYQLAQNDMGQGFYTSPQGNNELYVCRVPTLDEAGNETGAVYRGFRSFSQTCYLYEELDVPDEGGFTVTWEDNDHAVLTSGESSVVIDYVIE